MVEQAHSMHAQNVCYVKLLTYRKHHRLCIWNHSCDIAGNASKLMTVGLCAVRRRVVQRLYAVQSDNISALFLAITHEAVRTDARLRGVFPHGTFPQQGEGMVRFPRWHRIWNLVSKKPERLDYPMANRHNRMIISFWCITSVWRTDRHARSYIAL